MPYIVTIIASNGNRRREGYFARRGMVLSVLQMSFPICTADYCPWRLIPESSGECQNNGQYCDTTTTNEVRFNLTLVGPLDYETASFQRIDVLLTVR